jgi:hypothetical protein
MDLRFDSRAPVCGSARTCTIRQVSCRALPDNAFIHPVSTAGHRFARTHGLRLPQPRVVLEIPMATASSFVKAAASVLALSLFSHAAPAADVSIVPSLRTVTFDCDRIVIPDKSFLSVEVNRDAKKGVYVYRYTVRSSDAAAPAVHGILFKDLADNTKTSTQGEGVVDAITLESAAAPGVVRYSLIGEVEAGLTDEQLASLAELFGGNKERMLGSVDDVTAKSCTYSKGKDVFDRGMTGTIVGPSRTKMIKALLTPPPPDATDREIEMQSGDAAALLMENLDPESIVVTDSRALPLLVGPAALERKKDGTPVVRFTFESTSVACNARGVLVHGRMRDGTPVAASVDVEPSTCPSQIDQAQLVLPPAS